MFGNDNIQTINIAVQDPGADNKALLLWRAPAACEILRVYATADSAQAAGTATNFALLIYSALGTPALAGTVVAAPFCGTSSPLAAGVPKAGTIVEGTLSEGQWLVLDTQEDSDWSGATQVVFQVDYVYGIGA
jgi:hypothetical protein